MIQRPRNVLETIAQLERRVKNLHAVISSSGGVAAPATSVQVQELFGLLSQIGTLTGQYALADHAHGTPADPLRALLRHVGSMIYEGTDANPDELLVGLPGQILTILNLGNYIQKVTQLGPEAHYRMNEVAGTTMFDYMGQAHNGTYSGSGISYRQTPFTADGDYAVGYDGATGYSQVAGSLIPNGDWSIAFFFKTSQTTAPNIYAPLIDSANWGASVDSFGIGLSTTAVTYGLSVGRITVYEQRGSGRDWLAFTANAYNDGNWHLCVVTRTQSSDAVTVYIDGTAQALTNATGQSDTPGSFGGAALNSPANVRFGTNPAGSSFYNGLLDEVSFFTRVLTSAEVASLWANATGVAGAVPSWQNPLPPVGGGADQVLHGGGVWAGVDVDDIIGIGDATKFLRGDASWAVPPAGMTNPMTTQDDIIIGGAAGAPTRLPKSTNGYVLTIDATTGHVVWAASAGGGLTNPMTTAADLIVGGTGGTPTRLARGADGQVLTVDPTTHLLVWATPSGGSSTLASDTDVALTSLADGDLLQYVASAAKWENKPLSKVTGGDSDWIAVTYQNSWVDYGSGEPGVAYRKDALGFVHLRGWMKGGTVQGFPQVAAFTLPTGYRPTESEQSFSVMSNAALGEVRVHNDGTVSVLSGSNVWVALGGISFYAGPAALTAQLFATNYRARVTQTAAQTGIASGTWTEANIDTVTTGDDPSGMVSTSSHQITIPATGPYSLKGIGAFSTSSGRVIAAIAKNGTRTWFGPQFPASAALGSVQSHINEPDAWLVAGDVLTLWAYQDSGSAATLDAASALLEAIYLGSAASQADNAWTNVTYQNSWATYSSRPVAYRKDASGYVHLKGNAIPGSANTIFTLPIGYRPGQFEYRSVPHGLGTIRASIDTTGAVAQVDSGTTFVSLDGITFLAEN